MAMAMESGHSGHALHDGDTAGSTADTKCEHCPSAACDAARFCDVEISSACHADVPCGLDNRRDKLNLKDTHFQLPVSMAPTITATPFADHNKMPPGIAVASCLPGYQPPLNLLHCVYLI